MTKSKFLVIWLFALVPCIVSAQNKYEQELRIEKSAFPAKALELVSPYLEDVKRVRFYHEVDSIKKSYEVKFKKDRLRYSIEFDQEGYLEDVEFLIKEVDIPEESWTQIENYLKNNFQKFRIKKIQQQYPVGKNTPETTLKQAFQNLILEYINYELIFTSKGKKGYRTYEALFSSAGKLLKLRESLPVSYDHILY